MRLSGGGAVVLVYEDGRLSRQLSHPHDGGLRYMKPLLRQAVRYACTHYDAGDIVGVLKSEVEFACGEEEVGSTSSVRSSNHLYFVFSKCDCRTERRSYEVYAMHARSLSGLTPFPESAEGPPPGADRIA